MTATDVTVAQQMAAYIVEQIRDKEGVVDLYARQLDHTPQLWLFVDVSDIGAERGFRALKGELFGEFPRTNFDFRVVDVKDLGGVGRRSILPADAQSVLCGECWTP
jgi:hypothetical protein